MGEHINGVFSDICHVVSSVVMPKSVLVVIAQLCWIDAMSRLASGKGIGCCVGERSLSILI